MDNHVINAETGEVTLEPFSDEQLASMQAIEKEENERVATADKAAVQRVADLKTIATVPVTDPAYGPALARILGA